MTQEDILSNLCYYDSRNPDNLIDDEDNYTSNLEYPDRCYCDNCFYGRTKLAEYILTLLNKTEQ